MLTKVELLGLERRSLGKSTCSCRRPTFNYRHQYGGSQPGDQKHFSDFHSHQKDIVHINACRQSIYGRRIYDFLKDLSLFLIMSACMCVPGSSTKAKATGGCEPSHGGASTEPLKEQGH